MGCDITCILEYMHPESDHWSTFGDIYLVRDYRLFARMAGVRNGEHRFEVKFPPRGLPEAMGIMAESGLHPDFHHHSWLTCSEFAEILRDAHPVSLAALGAMRHLEFHGCLTRIVFRFVH